MCLQLLCGNKLVNEFQWTIDNEQLTMKESPAGMIEKFENYVRYNRK